MAIAVRTPRRRRRWIIVAGIAALLGLWLILQVLKIVFAVVSPDVDYAARIVEAVASRQAVGDENAWPIWCEAYEAASEVGRAFMDEIQRESGEEADIEAFRDYSRILFGPPDPQRWHLELEELRLLEERGVLALVERAGAVDRAVGGRLQPDPDFGASLLFASLEADLTGARELGNALAGRMRLAFLDADWPAHARAFDAALAGPQALGMQGISVYSQVALRAMTTALDELQYELSEAPIDPAHLVRIDAILAVRTGWLGHGDLAVEVDRLMMLDAVQHWYTDHGFGVGFAALTRVPGVGSSSMGGFSEISPTVEPSVLDRIVNLRAVSKPTRRRTVRDIKDWTQSLREVYAAPPHRRLDELGRVESAFQPRFNENEMLAMMISAAHSKMLSRTLDAMRQVHLVRLMIGIERYRVAHNGACPPSLEDLEDLVDSELLVDPLTGERFEYAPAPEHANALAGEARRYLLFAPAAEERDDERKALNALRPK